MGFISKRLHATSHTSTPSLYDVDCMVFEEPKPNDNQSKLSYMIYLYENHLRRIINLISIDSLVETL